MLHFLALEDLFLPRLYSPDNTKACFYPFGGVEGCSFRTDLAFGMYIHGFLGEALLCCKAIYP